MARDFFSRQLTFNPLSARGGGAQGAAGEQSNGDLLKAFYVRLHEMEQEVNSEVHGGGDGGGGAGGAGASAPSAAPDAGAAGGRAAAASTLSVTSFSRKKKARRSSESLAGMTLLAMQEKAAEKAAKGGGKEAATRQADEVERPPKGPLSPRERARLLGVKRDTTVTLNRRTLGKVGRACLWSRADS